MIVDINCKLILISLLGLVLFRFVCFHCICVSALVKLQNLNISGISDKKSAPLDLGEGPYIHVKAMSPYCVRILHQKDVFHPKKLTQKPNICMFKSCRWWCVPSAKRYAKISSKKTTSSIFLYWNTCNSFWKRASFDERCQAPQSNGNQPGADGGATYKSYKSLCPGIDTVGCQRHASRRCPCYAQDGLGVPSHALGTCWLPPFLRKGGVTMQKAGYSNVFGRY